MIVAMTWAFAVGAGEGNRTLMTSLEGWGSAIELRPRGDWSPRRSVPVSCRNRRWPGVLLPQLALCGGKRRQGRLRMPTGCSAAWLARLLWEQEVAGSNPAIPTKSAGHRLRLDCQSDSQDRLTVI